MGKFILKKRNKKFSFNLLAGNHEPILTSEIYESRQSAEKGIESVRKNATRDGAFEERHSKDDQWYFLLKSSNGQIVGKSEMYTTKQACQKGIESVNINAPRAETEFIVED